LKGLQPNFPNTIASNTDRSGGEVVRKRGPGVGIGSSLKKTAAFGGFVRRSRGVLQASKKAEEGGAKRAEKRLRAFFGKNKVS